MSTGIVCPSGCDPCWFVTFTGKLSDGIIEMHCDLAVDVQELFRFMLIERFPLSHVLPIAEFLWDDERSMMANNTSGFNYRTIAGTKRPSNHSQGRALDINPLYNPCIRSGIVHPAGAVYDTSRVGTLTADSPVTRFLKARGWIWGGEWNSLKDYQHFGHTLLDGFHRIVNAFF